MCKLIRFAVAVQNKSFDLISDQLKIDLELDADFLNKKYIKFLLNDNIKVKLTTNEMLLSSTPMVNSKVVAPEILKFLIVYKNFE